MDTRRLQMLLELWRRGSMREVAQALGSTTSTVSQQLAVLAREVGAELLEPHGRRVRLTPAGRRLAQHAVAILAAVEAAGLDLSARGEPAGDVRVAGFATAIRVSLLPIAADLAVRSPAVRLLIREHEPAEALELLAADAVDLALTYDYDLAPATRDATVLSTQLWSVAWGLGVPSAAAAAVPGRALDVFSRFRDDNWIVNSRNTADEQVVRTMASLAGFSPQFSHQADSLELVQDLIVAGLGVGLLPTTATAPGLSVLPLSDPGVTLRCFALTRPGLARWPPLALLLTLLRTRPGPA